MVTHSGWGVWQMKIGFAWILVLVAAGCATAETTESGFEHLHAGANYLESANGLDVRVEADGMRATPPTHRLDSFDDHPYEISLAALLGENVAILMHAERVADASGASDYSNLPAAEWPSAAFRTRQFCVTLSPDDIEGEHDLQWLRDNGFDPAGSLLLDQSFLTSADHNNEVVVSIAIRGVDCADEAGLRAALTEARARVRVSS